MDNLRPPTTPTATRLSSVLRRTRTSTIDVPVVVLRLTVPVIVLLGALGSSTIGSGPILCPLRAATGVPCPYCGLTRSVGATARADLPAALEYNPVGPGLVLLAVSSLFVRSRRTLRLPLVAIVVVSTIALVWNVSLSPHF